MTPVVAEDNEQWPSFSSSSALGRLAIIPKEMQVPCAFHMVKT